MRIFKYILFCYISLSTTVLFAEETEKSYLFWSELPPLPAVTGQTGALGVAGPFVGVHNNALIVAGGANFDKPYWENNKEWHADIWVLENKNNTYQWISGGKLDFPIAYGASVSTPSGVLCLGGNDAEKTFADVFLLKWDPDSQKIETETLPSLPETCAAPGAAILGDKVYVAGGTQTNDLATAMKNFWVLDLSQKGTENFTWRSLPSWPGPSRGYNMTVAQHNGTSDCIYVIGGRRKNNQGEIEFLDDIYAFDPTQNTDAPGIVPWIKCRNAPVKMVAGEAAPIGQSHIFMLGGSDGSLYHKNDELKLEHPGFKKQIWAYHTITDTWIKAGTMPQNHVTTQPVKWGNDYIIASGEVKPRVRSPLIWKVSPLSTSTKFSWIDYSTVIIYLGILICMGVFFSYRNKNTEDYFRGGQRIPWWASGCSMFATVLSSVTFMSIPAKTYMTNWVYFPINLCIVALAPVVIYYILPFFYKVNATSAYEYLERRFNLFARLIASASYILFQIGRMAIVMFLPALALSTVTPVSVPVCILMMGLMSIIYCTLGGLEAVIWTDTLQTFVLLGGALLSFLLIILNLDGGVAALFTTGLADQKFHTINWDWSSMSYTTTAFWVIVLGGIGQQLVPYSSDQGVVQRYMSVKSIKESRKAIWTNAVLSLVGTILFFGLGTGLYVFYKQFPHQLDPTLQNDSIFPQFISSQLPVGIAGLVIAGVFAAAQSTVSTSMNSIATAFTTDFVRRFNLLKTEKNYLNMARTVTLVAGIIGTGVALMFALADIKSMWDSFLKVIGLFGGPMSGLFILGIFFKRAHGRGAVLGALTSAAGIALVQAYTQVSFILYAFVGIVGCVVMGYLFSLILPSPKKDIDGLTI